MKLVTLNDVEELFAVLNSITERWGDNTDILKEPYNSPLNGKS